MLLKREPAFLFFYTKPMNLRSQASTLAPNSLANALNNSSSSEEFQETENIMANFSPEQFQQILAVIAGNQKGGSFTQCTARFKGQRDPAAVEEILQQSTFTRIWRRFLTRMLCGVCLSCWKVMQQHGGLV